MRRNAAFLGREVSEERVWKQEGRMGECVKVRLKEVKGERDETSSCASSCSSSPNTSVARSDGDWGQQFIAEGLPPIVQISPIRLCRRRDKHHHCRQTHTHVKDTDRKRRERNRNKGLLYTNHLISEFFLSLCS